MERETGMENAAGALGPTGAWSHFLGASKKALVRK